MKKDFGLANEATRIAWIKEKLLALPKGTLLLDAGAGEQQYKPFCAHIEYVSQDFAEYKPEELAVGLQTSKYDYGTLDIVSDIIAIPREDSSFDAILCAEVLEHLPSPVLAIKEFARLLKPRGKLILTAPFCSMTHFAPHHYATGFSKYFYEKHLADYDFQITETSTNGNYFEYLAQEMHRLPQISEKYSQKSLTIIEKIARKIMLKTLERFSESDSGSSELLTFGYHIYASKL